MLESRACRGTNQRPQVTVYLLTTELFAVGCRKPKKQNMFLVIIENFARIFIKDWKAIKTSHSAELISNPIKILLQHGVSTDTFEDWADFYCSFGINGNYAFICRRLFFWFLHIPRTMSLKRLTCTYLINHIHIFIKLIDLHLWTSLMLKGNLLWWWCCMQEHLWVTSNNNKE